VLATAAVLRSTVDTTYRMDAALKRMHAPAAAAPAVVLPDARPPADAAEPGPALARIHNRGSLRVGYLPGNAPFSFLNADGQLVGFNVELAQAFAESLGVRAEFVAVPLGELRGALAGNLIDLMPGVWYRPYWLPSLRLSQPYLTATMAIAVRDERRHEFATVEALRRSRGLKIGVPLDRQLVASSIRHYFGDADVQVVATDSWLPFFEGRLPQLDGFLLPAETGAAMTLLHPQFSVVVPQPDPVAAPMGFGAALHSADLVAAVDQWIVFAQSEGRIRRAYDYWVLGKGAEPHRRRWSVLHDVLGWGHTTPPPAAK
jgi:proton glutamate symport protein